MLSQTPRGIKKRERRHKISQERRFNTPLRRFIEVKYGRILEEYTELYNKVKMLNPRSRNLIKTKEWSMWEDSIRQEDIMHTEGSILQRAMLETLKELVPEASETEADETEAAETEADETEASETEAAETEAAEIEASETETVSQISEGDVFENDAPAINREEELINEADELIAELLAEPELNGLFHEENIETDEGIELNIFDEVAGDIEPFDYRLEVELAEW